MAVKKKSLTKKQFRYIENLVVSKLEKTDLIPWQEVCKSLAPPHYASITRSKWFEENKFRAEVGRKVVDFVDSTSAVLQEVDVLENIRVADIRSVVVKGVRKAERNQGISKYLLNDVKFATLRTIVGWIDHPERIRGKRNESHGKTRRGRVGSSCVILGQS